MNKILQILIEFKNEIFNEGERFDLMTEEEMLNLTNSMSILANNQDDDDTP